jgi:hypothetical protein
MLKVLAATLLSLTPASLNSEDRGSCGLELLLSVAGGVEDCSADEVGVAGVQPGEGVAQVYGCAVGETRGEAKHPGLAAGAGKFAGV